MAGNEPVVAPDQLKPGHPKWARAGALFTIIALLLMTQGNHHGNVENIFLVGIALIIVALWIIDVVLRRKGIRRS